MDNEYRGQFQFTVVVVERSIRMDPKNMLIPTGCVFICSRNIDSLERFGKTKVIYIWRQSKFQSSYFF